MNELKELFDKANDWNSLMPVIDKLQLIDGYSCVNMDHDTVFIHRKGYPMLDYKYADHVNKFGAVQYAVYELIKWLENSPELV